MESETQECETIRVPKCSTQYRSQCKPVQRQECNTVYENECKTQYQQQCSTQYKYVLLRSLRVFHLMTSLFRDELEYYTETECNTDYKQDCEYRWEGSGNNKVWAPIPGSCNNNAYDKCGDVQKQKLKQVPYQDCQNVPKQVKFLKSNERLTMSFLGVQQSSSQEVSHSDRPEVFPGALSGLSECSPAAVPSCP